MRSKRVLRYWCDYCNKGGQSKHHMEKHERRCTMNPGRECGMCEANGGDLNPAPLAELVAMLPDATEDDQVFCDSLYRAVVAALPALKEAADGCPVCIFAALRQRGVAMLVREEFDVRQEVADMWKQINADSRACGQW